MRYVFSLVNKNSTIIFMIKKIYLFYKIIINFFIYYISRYFLYLRTINHRKLIKNKKPNYQNSNDNCVVIFGSGKIINELTSGEKKKYLTVK